MRYRSNPTTFKKSRPQLNRDNSFRFWEGRITDSSNRLLLLLIALTTFIGVFPLLDVPLLFGGILNLIILAALSGTSEQKITRRPVIILAIAPLVAFAIQRGGFEWVGQIGFVLAFVFFMYVVLVLLQRVMRADDIEAEIIYGAVSCYLIIGLAWTMLFHALYEINPASFSYGEHELLTFYDFLYYSFVSLTTLGYGDLTPVSDFAKALAVIEAVIGVFYIGAIISRLVSLYGRRSGVGS